MFCIQGLIAPIPKDKDLKVKRFHGEQSEWPHWRYGNYHFYSKRYQWLPCEVAFRGDDEVEITSYINNLHPRQHEPLYKALESIIAKVSRSISPLQTTCSRVPELYLPPISCGLL